MGKKIGILNGGGDCAGINAVIAAAVKAGVRSGYEFVGIVRGFEGLLGDEPQFMPLTLETVEDISSQGGTILKSTNKGKFSAKIGSGDTNQIPAEILQEVKTNMEKFGIDSLIAIGGDGTLSGAVQLQDIGVKLVGVPKTIDNDLLGTDKTFGFSSAVDFVAEALDRIHTTAESHSRVIIVETMGRNTGWIALYGGISGDANIILIPELEFSYQRVLENLRELRSRGNAHSVIVVAEGAKAGGEGQIVQSKGENKEQLLGGIANKLMQELDALAPEEFEMRTLVLGHLQRGGTPNAEDRVLAQRYGAAAMELTIQENFGRMVRLEGNHITSIPLREAVNGLKTVTFDSEILRTARDLGIYFGD